MLAPKCFLWTIAIGLAATSGLLAQSVETDLGEFSGYTGVLTGMGGHPAVGASAGYVFSPHGIFLLDTVYSPLGSHTLSSHAGEVIQQSRLYNFNFSFHIQFPIKQRWAPYGIVGGGLLYSTFQRGASTPNGVIFTGASQTNFGFQTGGGVRYFVRPEWGIRPEVRVVVSSRTYTSFLVGVFYQFPNEYYSGP